MGESYVSVTEVIRNSKNRGQFRYLSRESSGEPYDPPEGDKVFFAFDNCRGQKNLVGVASYKPRHQLQTSSEHQFHELTYLFVEPYHQGKGVGKKLVNIIEKHALKVDAFKPMRLESARKAVGFFEKLGYTVTGEPKECVSGARLFRIIVPMEKSFRTPVTSSGWPDSTEDDW